jgi:rfaE bifunctional protein nucleotidyltransferase chain/domain
MNVDQKGFSKNNRFSQNAAVNFRKKIIARGELDKWLHALRDSGKKLVVTNGCFDLLHLGHVTYLEAAKNQGDVLLVGVTSDRAVGELKGPGRPVNSEDDRASVLASLESVDAVYIFPEKTAERFLVEVKPDIYVKGGDYTLDTINQDERRIVEKAGGKVVILAFVPGKSSTDLLKKLSQL